jgi:autotransporter-associated beta strand protein
MRSRIAAAYKMAKYRQLSKQARLAGAVALALPAFTQAQTNLGVVGLTKLLALDPSLTGAGVRVGQAEANFGTSPYLFEVNPATVGQSPGLFTYTDQNGNVTTSFNGSLDSWHADTVGTDFYAGGGLGVAPHVSHVDIYSADYFYNSMIFWDHAIPDAVVNQSFGFGQSGSLAGNIADQQASDTAYDNYIDEYGTIIVSAAGNGGSTTTPVAPSTNYNGIAVAVDDGSSAVGPTIDNGRSKPDITAPGGFTSFSTALVSGSAAILVQAADRGDGGASSQVEAAAADVRTIKALLLNGADKQAVTFNRTHTAPLDPANGAGLLNVYNSYQQLVGGDHAASSLISPLIIGDTHAPDMSSAPINSLSGWNMATMSSAQLTDEYANYVFQLPTGVTSYNLSATLVWNRPSNSNPAVPIGINNLDLYLYDTTANTLVDYSVSTVDNVQDVYDQNLTPGHRYDLEVFKSGGVVGVTPGLVSYKETYSLAYNFTAIQSVWNLSGSGTVLAASNWIGGVPDAPVQTASFGSAIKTASTVTFESNWVVGNINFNNYNSYNVVSSDGSPLILDNGGVSATSLISDIRGTHSISAPVQLNSNLSASISNSWDTLSILGNITDNAATGGASLTLGGSGTLQLGGVNTYRSGTTINSGALVIASAAALPTGGSVANHSLLSIQAGSSGAPVVAGKITGSGQLTVGGTSAGFLKLAAGSGASSQASVSISPGSTLDITNNTLAINFGSPTVDPVATVASALISGYAGGTWTGTGITSSSAAIGGSPAPSVGYADGNTDLGTVAGANQILIKYTLAGDANLDGFVNVQDLVAVVQNFGKAGKDWSQGNFTYSPVGAVTFADLVIVVQNLNKTFGGNPVGQAAAIQIQGDAVQVPEPGIMMLTPAAALLLARRRKWLKCLGR